MARRKKTQEEFIQEAQAKHGARYDYSKVCYVNSAIKVTVICPAHEKFEITPSHHLSGVGCRKCYGDRARNSQDAILARFREVHGNRYDYSKVVYEGTNLKIAIVCSIHGQFQQIPSAHIKGSGCPRCAVEEQTLTTAEFIEKARAKHGDRYDYSRVKYVNKSIKVTIICPQHGQFNQLPGNHLRGSLCRECAIATVVKARNGFEYKNTHYHSIKDACKKLGKDYWVVLKRLDAGWTEAQAFDDEPHYSPYSFEVNGVIYNSVHDAVCQLNAPVSAATVERRLAVGMSPEAALFTPPKLGYDKGITYVITNLINGKQYVGLTTTSLEERWQRHLEQALRSNAFLIHKAIAEFGKENFTIEVIDRANSLKNLRGKEREWIQKLNTLAPSGYNVTLGGEIGGAPGKPTTLPGDPNLYPTVEAAAKALAQRLGISQEAAEKRIYVGRIDVKKPHGMSKTRIYKYWDRLIHQASNPRSRDYNGSVVCDRWQEFTSFYEDMGSSYEEGLCLKLIDSSLPYSKDNCTWVTNRELYQTHGMIGTRIYRFWSALAYYTTNPESKAYKGVILCPRWRDFSLFYEDMGEEYEEGKILQLIDQSQPYSKDNCYWIWTYGEQQAHPLFKTPVYEVWKRIVNEWCNPRICARWRNFTLFCEDMASTYEKGFKLIRLDRDKPYSPENCEWRNRREAAQTHGMSGTRFYNFWAALKHKRANPTAKAYEGIALCERWQKFENFKADMYDSYQEGMGLKLLDPNQPYSKNNCRWITRNKVVECCDRL